MAKTKVTWGEYQTKRDEIWSKYNADETLTHAERAAAIKEELDALEVVK